MRDPDIPFRQFDFIRDSHSLALLNPTGVCRVLVLEWLSARGAIGAAGFSRGGGRQSTSRRLARSMGTVGVSRGDAINDYGLHSIAKSPRAVVTDSSSWEFLSQGDSMYYIKIMDDADGHAIGAVSINGRYRLFDPNKGVWECSNGVDLVNTMRLLAREYLLSDRMSEIEIERIGAPLWQA